MVKNFFSGKMIRLVLIQVQFLKKELLKAMGAMDEMVDANRLNVQLLAALPAVWLVSGASRLTLAALFAIRTKKIQQSRTEVKERPPPC